MIITCPACLTKFNLDDDRIPEGGAKVRCSKCRHVFAAQKPSPEKQIAPAEKTPPPETFEPFPPIPLKTPRQIEMSPRRKSSAARFLSRTAIIVITIIFIAAGIGYGVFLTRENPEVSKKIGAAFSTLKNYLGLSDERVGFIALEKVKGYYLENKTQTRVFVIEGRAVNRWQEPRSLIKVKGALLDAKGAKVEEKTSYCGNILLEEDLKAFSREEIAKSLSSQFGETFSNVNVPPGKSVPFMIVFTDFSLRGTTGGAGQQPAAKPDEGSPGISDFLVEAVSSQKGSEGRKRLGSAG